MSGRLLVASILAWAILSAGVSFGSTWEFEFEAGPVFSGYNDVRIPGDTGTRLSLVDDLKTDPDIFFRARLDYRFDRRHSIGVLIAPLSLEAKGSLDRAVRFGAAEFPAGTDINATYRFDSYRLTYRYSFYPKENVVAAIGFTGKIRDASIALRSDDRSSEKTNTGFVPLLHLRLLWSPYDVLGMVLEADALGAPQGRAEDVLLGLEYRWFPGTAIRLGYRVLEGGADNDEVYTFALLHYVVAGVVLRF